MAGMILTAVLILLLDDVSPQWLEPYNGGLQDPPTPNLVALAAGGVRFDRVYANTTCRPTRGTILTGRYGTRTGLTGFWPGFHVQQSEDTLPDILGAAGIPAYQLGKWHLGRNWNELDPIVAGYALHAGTVANLAKAGGSYWNWTRDVAYPWHVVTNTEPTYSTTKLVDDALTIISGQTGDWLLQVNFHAPHAPYHVPPAHLHSYGNPPDDLNRYKAMIEALDTEIGRLLGGVDPTSTTIIVLGDNGTQDQFNPGRGKGTMYEGGIRVPMIVGGAAVAGPGVSSALINTTDVFATVLEIFGRGSVAEDSESFGAILQDPSLPGARSWCFAEHLKRDAAGAPIKDVRAIVEAQFKLLEDRLAGTEEFYDLAADPNEQNPLPPIGPDYVRLRALLDMEPPE